MTAENNRPDITVAVAVAAYQKHGSARAAARALKCDPGVISRRLKANVEGAAMPPPAGQVTAGVSTLYDAEGRQILQWVKTRTEVEDQLRTTIEAIHEAFDDAPRVPVIKAPKVKNDKLLTVIPIGDQHHGMKAWADEAGENWDIKISAATLIGAMRRIIEVAPSSRTCIIANVGDFYHVDNNKAETSKSGNKLDVDTRYAAMIRTGIDMLRVCVEAALEKFETVKLINAPGNHDELGALWLSTAFALLYERNSRLIVEQSPAKFYYHRHGKVLLGVTHGDTVKIDELAGVMAADTPLDWGETQHRYWLTGHIHQRKVIEARGCMIESFRTLAARDAWATAAAYRSGRDLTAIVFHENDGEVERHRCDISMLEAA